MIYKYTYISQGKPITIRHDNREVVFSQAKAALEKLNVKVDANDLYATIDRQSNAVRSSKANSQNKKRVTLHDAFRAASALVNLGRGKVVTQQEIDRRAKICLTCPLNNKSSDCMQCGGAAKAVGFVAKLRALTEKAFTLPKQLETKYCGICGCSLPFMIVTRYQDIKPESAEIQEARPIFCWLKKTSPNFKDES